MTQDYDWQRADVQYLKEHDYTGLLAIEPGGTKTRISAMVVRDLEPEVVLIIAPDSTFNRPDRNWPSTIRDVTGRETRRIGNSTKADREALTSFELGLEGVYICTPQFMAIKSTDTSQWAGDLFIADEIHQLATAGSKGQRKLSGYMPNDPAPLSTRFNHRLALSGTPMRQNFSNMWAIMRFLWPDKDGGGQVAFDNFAMWQIERMDSHYVWTNRKDKNDNPIKVRQFDRESEPGRLVKEMPAVIIHKRREKCCEFHPKGFLSVKAPQVIKRKFDLYPEQVKAIHEMEEHMMTFLNDNPFVADIPLVAKQRIRQVCLGVPTITWTVEQVKNKKTGKMEEKEVMHVTFDPECKSPVVEDLLNMLSKLTQDEPVVVHLDFQQFAEVIVYRLRKAGFTVEEYSGKRKADLSRFGKDYQVLVAIVASFGTGTDGVQAVCQTEYFAETPVSLTMKTQAEARLDRPGVPRQVQQYIAEDAQGYAAGRLSTLLEKKIMVNKSLRSVDKS